MGIFKRKLPELPLHIAVFMDGNGRWAARKGLPRSAGHKAGARTIRKLVQDCDSIGLQYLTAYAFSTENWRRPKEEVSDLMNLLREFLDYTDRELDESDIRIKVIGLRSRLEEDIVQRIEKAERKTRDKTGLTFVIALDYGARSEIAHAAREMAQKCARGEMEPGDICEETFSDHLFTAGIPDPDLIIRSSGDRRMSNFLLWQASYAELWFSNILWPDFRLRHLIKAVRDYNRRSRRYGGLKG